MRQRMPRPTSHLTSHSTRRQASRRRIVPALAVAVAALAALALGAGPARAIDIFNLRNSLIQFALEQISTEDFTITATDVESPGDGVTTLVGVEIADREGVWFTAERLGLQWNARRILRAELEINRLEAIGVRVLRQPQGSVEVQEDAAIAEEPAEPFSWPRSPIATRVDEMRLERIFIAEGVVAPQSIAFDATGSARDEGDEQAVALTVTRTDDVAGRIALDYLRDFAANTLRANLEAEEAPGGLVAALAGLPEDSASRVTLSADGPLTAWAMQFEAEAERVLEADGRATVDLEGPLAVAAAFRVAPGPAMDPTVAGVLGAEARLDLDIAEDATGVIRIREGRVRSPALTLDADGTYDRATGAADLVVALDGRRALSDLVEGVAFEGFGFEGTVAGTPEDLTAQGTVSLAGLATEPADVGAARLATVVQITGSRIGFDVDGGAERLRIDRLGPDLLGEATLAAEGAYDAERLTLEAFRFAARPLSAEASGAVDIGAGSAALDYRLDAPELGPLAAAYDADAAGQLAVSGRVEGPFDAVRLTGEAALEGLAFEGEEYGEVRLTHDVTAGEAIAGGVVLAASGSPYGPLEADLDFRLAGERLDLSRFTAEALGMDLEGAVVYRLDSGLADGTVRLDAPDLGPLAAFAGAPVAGSLAGEVVLEPEGGRQRVRFDLTGREIAALGAGLRSLALEGTLDDALGAPALDARLDAAGLSYEDARLDGLSGTVSATDLTGAPDLVFDVVATDAAGFGASAGRVRLDGRIADATRLAEVTARLEAEALAYQDASVGRLTADLAARDALSDLPTGTLTARAETLEGAGVRTASADLTADLAAADGTARLTAALETAAIAAEGARIASARLDATVADALGPQPAIDARLATGAIEAGEARIESARLDARLREPLSDDPSIEADLATGPVAAGTAALEGVAARVAGRLSALDATVSADGTAEGEPVSLAAAARIDAARSEPRIVVSSLEAGFAGERVALAAPLTVTAGETVRMSGLDLTLPDGRLAGEAALHPNGISADLALTLADLGIARRLADAPVTEGALDATVRIDTRPGRAGGTLDLAARGVRFADAVADIGALDFMADAQWDGRQADLTASVDGPFGDPVRVTAALPVRASGGPLPRLMPREALSGRVVWTGEVGDLWALVPAPGHVLAGRLDIDLGIGGTLEEPRIEGDVALDDGRYENLDLGTILTDLTLRSRIEGTDALALSLEARDGAEGRVTAEARLDAETVEASLRSAGAILVRRDDATAAISLDIRAAGPLAGPDITGTVTIDRAEIRLVNATPPSVATLGDVRIKGVPQEPEPEPAGGAIGLDLVIRADRNIFVRGRGLDSEWRMALDVAGTAADPRVTGAVERVRGRLSLIGTVFDLETGTVRFAGGREIDPRLDIRLQAEENGVTGGILVTGTASDPEIGFWSRQGLPEDEVLPRILFGKPSQSLSTGQAIRLASGLATLFEGSGGVVDRARSAVGLDVLTIDPTEGGADVTVGQNIGDDVFVGARQAVDGSATRVTVEVEVFDNVTVDSEVDPTGAASVGLNWKKDF